MKEIDEAHEIPSLKQHELQNIMREQVRHYSFQNDHIMRGPLCRAVGLIDLLKREDLPVEARKLLEMLMYEVRQVENVTFMISKMLDDHDKMLDEADNRKK